MCILKVFVVFVLAFDFGKCDDCQRHLQLTEKYVERLLFLSNDSKVPKSDQELQDYCESAKGALGPIKEYNSCLKGIAKQVYNVFFRGVAAVLRTYCGKNVDEKEVLQSTRCFSRETLQEPYRCLQSMRNHLEFIVQSVPPDEAFPTLCCSIHILDNCTYNRIRQTCGDGAQEGASFFQGLLKSLLGNFLRFGCSKEPDIRTCLQLFPQRMSKLREIGLNPLQTTNVSMFVEPLLKVVDKLTS